jgi:hypothetical protein
LLRREVSLFLFAFVSGVEPTNNAAARALRHGVLWRKQSHGPKYVLGVYLVGGGDVPTTGPGGLELPDGVRLRD